MTTPESAYSLAQSQLSSWGLGTLAPKLIEFMQQGVDDASLMLKLRETDEYKQRFAGMEMLKAKGLRVPDEAEYLAKEEALRAQLSDPDWGLPSQFYDSPDDYARIIGTGMGAQELQGRLQAVKTVVTSGALTGVLDYARSKYSLTTGDLMAFYLDPDKAAPLLTTQARAAAIGAAAARSGYGDISSSYAEKLDALGVSADQAQGGFQQAASMQELTQDIGGDAGVSGEDVTSAIFEQNQRAAERVESAQNRRLARFQGGGNFAESKTGIAGLGTATT